MNNQENQENYEERKINWGGLFLKSTIVVVIVLLIAWIISLLMGGFKKSFGAINNSIFADNIDRMKDAGISYYTNERLPKKIGDVSSLTLKEMYDKKLILEVKDKDNHSCSEKDSYVSVEKYNDYEYHMKVYLECGEEEDYINVILGCYDYCKDKICEKEGPKYEEPENLEYEYSKTEGGHWSSYGPWSEWSKVFVSKTDYRDVEEKEEKEIYEYDKTVAEKIFKDYIEICPEGYNKDGSGCSKVVSNKVYSNPNKCPNSYNGYSLIYQNGFTCYYEKNVTITANPNKCPSTNNGANLIKQEGFTCYYESNSVDTIDPICPSASNGFTFVERNGFTCTYTKNQQNTVEPSCPKNHGGYSFTGRNGFTCNYRGTYSVPYRVAVGKRLVSSCNGCAPVWQTVYETRYRTETGYSSTTAKCPSGYMQSGSSCVSSQTVSENKDAYCENGYTRKDNKCIKNISNSSQTTVGCPNGFRKENNSCIANKTESTSTTTTCPNGFNRYGNTCMKETNERLYENMIKYCENGYFDSGNGNCYKVVDTIKHIKEERIVKYYRYRLREYVGGSVVDYKWSKSKNDQNLINAGYKLTGKTRVIGGK